MTQANTKKTFVLVHGSWHGGWCWRRVADGLRAKGHKVFAPTLTGVGERSHLLSREINLDTHIADIVNVFRFEDIRDACLVAHSYGGWPSSGALEQIHDRVSAIVWLDAFKPENGQSWFDFANPQTRAEQQAAWDRGDAGNPPPKAEYFKVNPKDRAWVDSLLTPQPIGTRMQKIKLTGARERIAKKLYIRAPSYPNPGFDKAYAQCKADPSWRALETTAGHDVMVDEPEWLTDVLIEAS